MTRRQKILARKTKWATTFIENSGGRAKAEQRIREKNSRAGSVKSDKKGFAGNSEAARKAAEVRWAKEKR